MAKWPLEDPYRTGYAETFGWMRRPELDIEGGYAWEKPNGELFMSPQPKVLLTRLVMNPSAWPTNQGSSK